MTDALYFPDPLPREAAPLLLVAERLVCYQPTDTPRAERAALCPPPLFLSRNPAPVGEAESRLQRLIRDLEQHGEEFLAGLSLGMGAADGGVPTIQDLVTQISGRDKGETLERDLWDARLFLALAESRLIAETDLLQRLAEMEERRRQLLAGLRANGPRGDKEREPDEKRASPWAAAPADLDLGAAGLRAWAALHERDPQPAAMLAAAPGSAADYLLEVAERKGIRPERLASLPVPPGLTLDTVAGERERLQAGRAPLLAGLDRQASQATGQELVAQGVELWRRTVSRATAGELRIFFLPGLTSHAAAALLRHRRQPQPSGGPGGLLLLAHVS